MGWIILIINNLIILSELSLFNSHMCVLAVCKGPLPDPLGDILVKSPLCHREPCVPAKSNITWFQGVLKVYNNVTHSQLSLVSILPPLKKRVLLTALTVRTSSIKTNDCAVVLWFCNLVVLFLFMVPLLLVVRAGVSFLPPYTQELKSPEVG